MIRRAPFLAALPLCLAAAAALAAPPLAIPIPRPTPEQEALMIAEDEETRIQEELEEARSRAEAAETSDSAAETSDSAAETPDSAVETSAPPVEAPIPPPPAPPVETAALAAPAPVPQMPVPPAPVPAAAEPATPESANASTNDVFRRDPFWSVAVTRARKADHDARVAARIEAEKRAAAIEKARQDAIARGVDVSGFDDDEVARIAGASALPARPKSASAGSFGGATEEQWDAALAKIPPRSGYLGGKRPALMLKGDKTPHYAGDRICVTNRGVVFTWRIETVDFRAYTHELERVGAAPVKED